MISLGPNRIADPGFDDPAKWLPTVTAPSISAIVGSRYYLKVGDPITTAHIVPLFTPQAQAGHEYVFELVWNKIGPGPLRYNAGEGGQLVTQTGYYRKQYVATLTESIVLTRNVANTEYYVTWVSHREVGASMSKLVLSMRDFDGDKRQTSIEMGLISDGTSYGTVSAQMAALASAIDAVTAGNIARQQFVSNDTEPNDTNAANVLAQTSYRWIIEYVDAVTGDGPYQIDIPTPDLGDNTLVLAGSNHHDPANAEWVTLKAAMEGGEVKNPRTGNNISITSIFLEQ